MAGVVLEAHLAAVCAAHPTVTLTKKNPTISDFNDALKNGSVYDIPTWRKIQHLGDLRNLCGHKGQRDPIKDEVSDLIDGVAKATKTIF